MPVYITATGRFLPGEPVPSDEIEEYIGVAGKATSNLREQTVANAGIKTRHYAIDKQQQTVYSISQMSAQAIREAAARAGVDLDDIELIAAGTSIPELILPGMASMVHGELGNAPCEIITTHGVCNSGMMALKSAYLQVAAGEKRTTVATACEFTSRTFKSQRMAGVRPVDDEGSLALEMAFLRYMLSDGAGAAVIQDRPVASGVSLRIDWVTLTSYANTGETCMYFGLNDGGSTRSWWDYPDPGEALADGALALRQNLGLLPHLVKVGIDEYERLLAQGRFDPDRLRWLPVHYSSERMKRMVLKEMRNREVHSPPEEIWYSNLPTVGNIGCASIYVILDEILTEGLVNDGDTLLCMVPESGRFSVAFMHLTAVRTGAERG
jgi:3-oxoacyl-[acyl-carrier-protein] synthase-3